MVTVEDDGRGVPVGKHSTGKDALEVVHTVLHAGGKFGGGGYKVSGGLHGVGVTRRQRAVRRGCASRSARDGGVWAQEYERGKPDDRGQEDRPAGRRGAARRRASWPTPRCSRPSTTRSTRSAQRLRESAYLTKGVWITLVDERIDRERSFYFEGGLVSFVRHLNRNKEVAPHPPDLRRAQGRRDRRSRSRSSTTTRTPRTSSPSPTTSTRSTAAPTSPASGGPDALAQRLGAQAGVLKDADGNLTGDDVREGLTAVISVKLTDPQFEGQTKAKLGNAEVKGQVADAPSPTALGQYLEENPADGRRIIEKCLTAARAREAARKARDLVIRKGALDGHVAARQAGRLPGARPRARASCTSSRATRPAARPSRAATGASRRSCRCAARSSTSRRPGSTRSCSSENVRPLIIALGAGIGETLRHREAALPPDHHHDRRRRRRRPHPHAAADLLLPPHAARSSTNGYLYIAQPPLYRVSTGKVTKLRPVREGARPDHQGVQRQEPDRPALQGPRRDERRPALGDDDEPGDADAAAGRRSRTPARPTRSSRC